MPQFDDDDEDFTGENISEARKAERSANKRIKALEAELAGFRTESRTRALQGAIEAKGLNPKIAAFVPADVDTSAIGAWIEEYGDVFAPQGAPVPPVAPPPIVPDGADTFSEVAASGAAPTGDEGQLMALISGAKTPEELNKILGLG